MPPLALAIVFQLATINAPKVAPETVLAFAQAESGMNPLAIHTAVRHAACLRNSAHDEFSSFSGGAGELGRPVFYAGAS